MKNLFGLFEKRTSIKKQSSTLPSLPEAGSVEVVSAQEALLLRGGDKEYTPPFYENVSNANWSKPNILLN